MFVEAGLAKYLGGHKIASGAGLLTAIHRQPRILFQIDEFGMFLSAAADRRRSPRHITDILDNMTRLYFGRRHLPRRRICHRDGQNERRDINQPCLCVYGTTTPLHFWNALQASTSSTARSPASSSCPPTTTTPTKTPTPASGRRRGRFDDLKRVSAGGARRRKGNLVGKTSGLETAVDAIVVPMHPDAREAFRTLSNEITGHLREARGTAYTAILARIGENAQKLAMIVAVGRDPATPEITTEDAAWSIGFVRHFANRTMESWNGTSPTTRSRGTTSGCSNSSATVGPMASARMN